MYPKHYLRKAAALALGASAAIALCVVPSPVFAGTALKLGPSNFGLVGWWKFDEGTSTKATDSSGTGNKGTLTGSTPPAWTAGRFGQGLSFDGSSSRVSLGTTGIPSGNSNYTLSAWIKTPTMGTYGIVGWGQWATGNAVNALRLNVNGVYNYWWANDLYYPTTSLGDNKWHLITATFDGTTRTIYVDGAYGSSDTPVGHNAVVTDVNIGRTNTTEYFPGKIDDVRIYNRALSAAEVLALYQAGSAVISHVSGQGLSGAYYDGTNLNTYVSTHTDSTINFNPADSLGVSYANSADGNTFSVRWTGYILAPYTGTYTFYTVSDDGARLTVNNQSIVDSWIDQSPTEHSGTINLTAGKWYPIRLDFYENGGGAEITLSWSEASITKAIVAAQYLKPASSVATPGSSAQNTNGSSLKSSGLVGLWTFDGKDTNWATNKETDESGNGNTGNFISLATSTTPTIGKLGQAFKNFSATSYVDVPTSSSLNPGSTITVSGWFYPTSSGQYNPFVAKQDSGGTVGWEMANSSGTLRATLRGSLVNVTAGAVTLNKWQMGTFTYDGSTLSLYLNGALTGTASGSATLNSGNDLTIGERAINSDYFRGSVDDIRVYNRVLSAAQILQLYRAGK